MKEVKRVFSGTRATGRLHLGNYLGAVKGYIELSNKPEYDCIYMAMDLHTITTPYIPQNLKQAKLEIIIDYLAAGLDPDKCIITLQSLVPEHSSLMFLFSSVVSVARMRHLPTFKDKVKQYPDSVTMALLNYPVLMAADILVYKASLVPVGIDQEPHLEVAREIARKMNDIYSLDFPEPVRFATKGEYVPSLGGVGKMSKSVEGSYINLTDSFKVVQKKLAGVPTDSGTGSELPREGGVLALLSLVELFEGESRRKDFEKQYLSNGIRYRDLKEELAIAIDKELKPIRERRLELENNKKYVEKIIKEGAEKAREIASKTLEEVREHMGLAMV
jgi:tryptophanyl-tRNA synthetase